MRHLLLATALSLSLAPGHLPAQDGPRLPDIGSSAGELLTPARQAEYGAMMVTDADVNPQQFDKQSGIRTIGCKAAVLCHGG